MLKTYVFNFIHWLNLMSFNGPYARLDPDNASYRTSPNGYTGSELYRNWVT